MLVGDGMSKLALFLIGLAMLNTCCASSFQRPWQNSTWIATNPAIWSYGFELWWNFPELSKTLESLDIQKTGELKINDTAKTHVDQAVAYNRLANENKNQCMETDTLRLLWGYTAGGPGLGLFVNTLSEFSRISSCIAYRQNWVGAVDSSLCALEESGMEAENSLKRARTAYKEIEFMGLCNSNYTRAGSESCAEMQGAFNTIDANITEGKYGKYQLMLDYSYELNENLKEHTPKMSRLGAIMGLIWGDEGVVSSLDAISLKAEEAKGKSEAEFRSLSESAEGRKQLVAKELKELEKQDVHLITSAPSSYEVHRAGTMSELYYDIQEREDKISIRFADMELERNRLFKKDHMANAILGMADVDSAYAELIKEIENLEEHARTVVGQQASEAKSELEKSRKFIQSSAQSSESLNLYKEAEHFYVEGDEAATLGKKFVAYSKAASYARAAQNQRLYEEELAIKSSLKELEELLKNAEKDEINVATEQESLKLLAKLQPYQIDGHVRSSIDSIILKAKIKYDDELLRLRKRIYDKLSLAGPSAADLYTDLARCEDGVVEGGQIGYPHAIGQLKKLKEDYLVLEDELEQYVGDIVGNSMSTTAIPLIDGVWLDEPSEITLDLVITNPRNYMTNSAAVKIALPTPTPFLYSDVIVGREGAESLRMTDNDRIIILILSDVRPFETRRLMLEKQGVIAHTISKTSENHGLGNGAAHLMEKTQFQLDMDIQRLSLPEGSTETLIDGADPARPLKEGKHVLSSERIMDNAYSERIENIKSYNLGTNSKVEYSIKIHPNIDLDTVLVFIDSLNDSRVSSLNVGAATGEAVKNKGRVSESQYTATVKGLKKDRPTVLKISYLVEDTASFVNEQIGQLESANLSENSQELLEQARIQAEGGNYSMALEFLEKTRALQKDEEKQRAKLQKEYDGLNKKLIDELGEISTALSATNASAPLLDKLSARKDELQRLLNEAKDKDLSEKVDIIKKTDYKWLEKELNSFRKEAYKEYNDLKESFYLAGNSSTPSEFLEFESALNKLETGGRLEYAVQTLLALQRTKLVVESQENTFQSERQSMEAKLQKMKSEVEETLGRYTKEASSAKGTEYSSLFRESERNVDSMLKEAEKSLDSDPRVFNIKLDNLNKSRQRMQLTLSSLESESKARLSLVETLFSQSEMNEKDRRDIASKMSAMRSMLEAGEYVNALRAGSSIGKDIDSLEQKEDNSLLLLGITALAVLAIVAAYMIRQQKGEGKKQLRKLERTEEELQSS
jgi:hypothetical protein